jgi:1,4-alpha-glucan branching enzyme
MTVANDKPKRKPRVKTEFPDDFVLDDEKRAVFRKFNPTATDVELILQFEKFKAHHQMRGDEFKDWSAAWRYWTVHAAQYGFRPKTGNGPNVPQGAQPGVSSVPIGAVARSTWAAVGSGQLTNDENERAIRSMTPEEQRRHLRELVNGIGKGIPR